MRRPLSSYGQLGMDKSAPAHSVWQDESKTGLGALQ